MLQSAIAFWLIKWFKSLSMFLAYRSSTASKRNSTWLTSTVRMSIGFRVTINAYFHECLLVIEDGKLWDLGGDAGLHVEDPRAKVEQRERLF
jgi:hypothetical protein